jgi:hypothetical protein
MTKFKALFGLTMLVALLAISAAPASAWFESTSTKTSGTATVGKTTFTTGTLSVTCEKAEGEWKIRLKTTQIEAKVGEHKNVLVKKWNNCKDNFFGTATVKECEFQAVQVSKGFTTNLTGSIVTGCEITSLGCIISLPSKGNESFGKITEENSGSNSRSSAEVKEILGTYKGCGLAEKEKTGKLIFVTLQEGMKLV